MTNKSPNNQQDRVSTPISSAHNNSIASLIYNMVDNETLVYDKRNLEDELRSLRGKDVQTLALKHVIEPFYVGNNDLSSPDFIRLINQEELKAIYGDDWDQAKIMHELFLRKIYERIDEIQEMLERNDFENLFPRLRRWKTTFNLVGLGYINKAIDPILNLSTTDHLYNVKIEVKVNRVLAEICRIIPIIRMAIEKMNLYLLKHNYEVHNS